MTRPHSVLDDDDERTVLEKVEKLQSGFIGVATQDGGSLDAQTYFRLRQELMTDPITRDRIPEFVRKCRDDAQVSPHFPCERRVTE